jgi:hypothetical protein
VKKPPQQSLQEGSLFWLSARKNYVSFIHSAKLAIQNESAAWNSAGSILKAHFNKAKHHYVHGHFGDDSLLRVIWPGTREKSLPST